MLAALLMAVSGEVFMIVLSPKAGADSPNGYSTSAGASCVDLANGSGGWTGINGPAFSAGWNVYTGVFDHP